MISLSNTDPVWTSVHRPHPPLRGFDREHVLRNSVQIGITGKHRRVGREGGNQGRDVGILFLPNPPGIPCVSRQIYTNTIHVFSSKETSLDF